MLVFVFVLSVPTAFSARDCRFLTGGLSFSR